MSYIEDLQELGHARGVRWDSALVGLVAFSAPTLLAFLSTYPLLAHNRLLIGGAVACLAGILGLIAWRWTCTTPKTPANMVGIAFAISAESGAERRRLKADLLDAITTQLEDRPSSVPFKVLAVPSYLAPDVTNRESAQLMRQRCRAKVLVWGAVRTRRRSGKEYLVVRLEGQVSHRQTAINRSQALGREMRSAIPKQTEIDLADELAGFEATSQNLADAAKFIVALAAAVSDEWVASKMLLEELYAASKQSDKGSGKRRKTGRSVGQIAKSLPQHLAPICYADYGARMEYWEKERSDASRLAAAEKALEDHRKYAAILGQVGPPYWIAKANIEVSLRRNFSEANRLLSKCKAVAIQDPTWRLSLAFVLTLLGQIDRALDQYDAALDLEPDRRTVVQIEGYVQWWYATNSGPVELLLLSALLNAKAKDDKQLAIEDLNRFTANSAPPYSSKVQAKVDELRML